MQLLDTNSKSLSVSNAFYKRLISIYPASFKLSFRTELEQVFDNKTQSVYQNTGWVGVSAFWLRTLLDTFQTALHEHIEELFNMKLNPKKTTTSGFALIAGLMTVFIVVSNWAELPYPFPTKLSLYGRYVTFNMISKDNIEFQKYIEELTGESNYPFYGYTTSVISLPDSVYEEVLGEAPNIPRGQKPSINEYQGYGYFFRIPITGLYSAQFRHSSWGPDMVSGNINFWENYTTPFTIALPLMWLGVLILLLIWTESGKLGYFGISLGIVGSLTMLVSLEELFRDFNIFNVRAVDTLWLFFTIGTVLLGLGLILFGSDKIMKKSNSAWRFTPILMGLSLISLEIISRFYLTNDLILWPRVQGSLLLIFSLAWIPFALHFFNFKISEISPA